MYRKAVSLLLVGLLVVGTATVAYGTFFDQGLAASVGAMFGAGEHGHRGDGHDDDD